MFLALTLCKTKLKQCNFKNIFRNLQSFVVKIRSTCGLASYEQIVIKSLLYTMQHINFGPNLRYFVLVLMFFIMSTIRPITTCIKSVILTVCSKPVHHLIQYLTLPIFWIDCIKPKRKRFRDHVLTWSHNCTSLCVCCCFFFLAVCKKQLCTNKFHITTTDMKVGNRKCCFCLTAAFENLSYSKHYGKFAIHLWCFRDHYLRINVGTDQSWCSCEQT